MKNAEEHLTAPLRNIEEENKNKVNLLSVLKTETQAEGKTEQRSYDGYVRWCEETLGRKANALIHQQ